MEVGAGTCRNASFYPTRVITRLVLTDKSANMLEEGKKKIVQTENVEFIQMDSSSLKFPDNSFDTVIDTFGLCSFDDPVQVLKEMQRVWRLNLT